MHLHVTSTIISCTTCTISYCLVSFNFHAVGLVGNYCIAQKMAGENYAKLVSLGIWWEKLWRVEAKMNTGESYM